MTTRIPPSIAWLANKYSSVKSELAELERELAILQARRDSLRSDANSLERVISIHEVPIEASEIVLRRNNVCQKKMAYGFLTKAIYGYLSNLQTGHDASISEIFYAVICAANIDANYEWEFGTLRTSVAHQLRNMLSKNQIIRTFKGNGTVMSRYGIKKNNSC